MKKSAFIAFVQFMFLAGIQPLWAQDKMILVNKSDTLSVKVTQTAPELIRFYNWNDAAKKPDSIERAKVLRIIFENGTVMRVAELSLKVPLPVYGRQRDMAIKLGLGSLLIATVPISFEKSIGERQSVELGLGLIIYGLFLKETPAHKGIYLRAGYKAWLWPTTHRQVLRAHLLKGWYIRPDLFLSAYQMIDYWQTATDEKYLFGKSTYTRNEHYVLYQRRSAALTLNFGRQWVLNNRFCIDLYLGGGFGYGYQKMKSEVVVKTPATGYFSRDIYSENRDEWMGTGLQISHQNEGSFAAHMGLRFGYIFGRRNNVKRI